MSAYTFRHFTVREDIIQALHDYAWLRVPLGDFLRAVVSNNLFDAIGRADDDNLANMPAIVGYVYNEMPSQCWGSPAHYKAWVKNEAA